MTPALELTVSCACPSPSKSMCPDLTFFDMGGPDCEAWANMGHGNELDTLDIYLNRQSLERIKAFCEDILARPDPVEQEQ